MDPLRSRLSSLLDTPIERLVRLRGGDLSQVFAFDTADGRRLIAKPGGRPRVEADMLRAIAATGCPAPQIVLETDDVLVMTCLPDGKDPTPDGWFSAGRAVSSLHACVGTEYGWREDTAFGDAECPAAATSDWCSFWAERRLLAWPDTLPAAIARRLETLAKRLPASLPKNPRPSLLHGDLWSGNLLFDGAFSGLIDPACYHGDAEVDLAMLTLFGAPAASFWEAYGSIESGWRDRCAIYQLWPALVHLRLFGAGYRDMVEARLTAAGV